MIAAMDIQITKASRSRINEIDFNNLPFGKNFTDHMLEVDYSDGEWGLVRIRPFQSLVLSPSLAALHYGQAIFEGIKAYRDPAGNAFIFRPFDNFTRFNISAARMRMPAVPEELFIEGMRKLVELDRDWIPMKNDYSLYIRPIMFATDEVIGVKASDNYKFMILLSPTGPYYAAPMRIYVEEKYTRAAPGGVGFAKTAGNYGSAMQVTAEAREKGYDQVLWMDAFEHKWVQEIGTMNVFFIIGNRAITPDLNSGTILAGVTRDSVIEILKELGYSVEERPIHIDEVIEAHRNGALREIFGTGTAATVSMIRELTYKDYSMTFDTGTWTVAPSVKSLLTDIREGRKPDKHGWMFKV
ncbi:MAG: branched-chain amino acid aminotransferase [Bacteroidota bacterium]|nr:branched-chain amino acid aminotransferase [Bacteroidota bacterium]MDP4215259.1 branched-chain amino acid aminotransferase [Bacteroidota bacterium]MDP4246340.1 branched-chain amino acid aminotransferase [Bacteroidota bacterium]MDP4253513.1 branched-chain amino acid aminotransferase [Bacteroidota bacterium]MDP4258107.1 branched-chain amino acid aminotransferase [Bacteroidota bacterium]